MAKQISIQTEYENSLSYGAGYNYGSAAPQLEPRRKTSKGKQSKSKQKKGTLSDIAPGFLAFCLICAAIVIIPTVMWLSANSEKTSLKRNIESVQSELQGLRADNDATEVYLNKSIDLEYIYKVATEELGMVYPSDDQIIYYERSDEGYVRQYEDIPNE